MTTEALNKDLISLSAADRLRLICSLYPEGVVFSTSLGQEDQVLTHLIARQQLPVEIFTLDTGRLFQETYDIMDRTIARYKVTIRTYFPDTARVEELVTRKGPNSFYESVENRKECCFIRKVEPLNRALKGAKVWITGLRAEQSENRHNLSIAEWDESRQLLKVNPLLDWTYEEMLSFIEKENIPYNKLHDKGFPSIGCAPCTRAIEPGEDIRAGRWWWEASQKECGLHQEKVHS
ncbi:phosphoadenylyl-sulfate reductase [Flavihumibacter petaseus]|uniref:Adenosine 5'-phosphosulfate reductase n=1 Tax=Flavihumibacter petaseus NBRC 106054 TaxID=1220578 RepID=A0A0E9N3G1_9BACT|nr:phosphoadenylyl-sulfate reductase [Flavihumibacter petaseus]GAO43880.1 5'-adenylylsulfate reductase [Flavihumibacter petaseus NBRC 106054]